MLTFVSRISVSFVGSTIFGIGLRVGRKIFSRLTNGASKATYIKVDNISVHPKSPQNLKNYIKIIQVVKSLMKPSSPLTKS